MEKAADKLLSPLVPAIASSVNSLGLRRFEEGNTKCARVLQETLASTQPICSRRLSSDTDIFSELSSLRIGETTPPEAYAVLTKLDEEPVKASEILTAGWLYRLSTLEDQLKKAFSKGRADQGVGFDTYGSYVEKTDFMLLKSLELADVHAVVLGWLS